MASSFFQSTLAALLIIDDPASTTTEISKHEDVDKPKLEAADTSSQPETETSSQMEGDGTIDSHHDPEDTTTTKATEKIVIPHLEASLAEADTSDSGSLSTLGIDDDDGGDASRESAGPHRHHRSLSWDTLLWWICSTGRRL